MLLRIFALLGAAMLTLGPALAQQTGKIDGRIVLSPAEPVTRVGKPNERGVPGRVKVINQKGDTVAELSSDSKGRFWIALKPGKYTLHLEAGSGRAADRHVTVAAGEVTKTVIRYDAGIR